MITRICGGKLILPEGIVEGKDLYFEDGVITAVTDSLLPADRVIDAEGSFVSPGFIDIHVHGGDGYEFCDPSQQAILNAANIHGLHGTTTIFPTISAYDVNTTTTALETIENNREHENLIPNIGGVHLEGPYFSAGQCGAQDPQYIRDPVPAEYSRFVERFGDLIARWSYAPERSGSEDFQRYLSEHGIIGSAGHTDAEYSHMQAVYDLGCKLVTHLYSCTSSITRKGGFRHLGVIESAWLLDELDVEAIADGCHLPPALLKMIYKLKGPEHMCLVTDAIRFGGCTSCDTAKGGTESVPYIIEDGVAKLADRSAFAGSIATTDTLIRVCTKDVGIGLADAVKMLTQVPARIMNLPRKGQLKEGFDADIIFFDENISVRKVIVGGKVKV